MKEITNTGGKYPLFPAGHYIFSVTGKPEKFKTSTGGTYRKWRFKTVDAEGTHEYTTVIFPWQSRELLIAVGGEEQGDEVAWDDEAVEGKQIECDIEHKKDRNGIMRAIIQNIVSYNKEGLPF